MERSLLPLEETSLKYLLKITLTRSMTKGIVIERIIVPRLAAERPWRVNITNISVKKNMKQIKHTIIIISSSVLHNFSQHSEFEEMQVCATPLIAAINRTIKLSNKVMIAIVGAGDMAMKYMETTKQFPTR